MENITEVHIFFDHTVTTEIVLFIGKPVPSCGEAQPFAQLYSQIMKVNLVCRRKHPYLKVIANWEVDKSDELEPCLKEKVVPNSHEKREELEARWGLMQK